MKIIVCGGGTAGHIYPALATIIKLQIKEPKAYFLYVGTKNKKEREIVQQFGIPYKGIYTGKLRRYWNLLSIFQNFFDVFFIIIGFFQSIWIIGRIKPNVIFSKGGYVGLLPVLAGWVLRIPCIVHESDAQIGLANKISLYFCKKIAISFPPDIFPELSASEIIFTGNPIRNEIIKGDIERAKRIFRLDFNLPVVLVTGGSQGASRINKAISKSLPKLLSVCQIIHICGEGDFDLLKSIRSNLDLKMQKRYVIKSYLRKEMKDALAVADLVVSRAGANIIFELSLLGKPAILIPLSGHQVKNAQFFQKNDAAIVIQNEKFNSLILVKKILDLFENSQQLSLLSKNIRNLAEPEAASTLAEEIIKIATAKAPSSAEASEGKQKFRRDAEK